MADILFWEDLDIAQSFLKITLNKQWNWILRGHDGCRTVMNTGLEVFYPYTNEKSLYKWNLNYYQLHKWSIHLYHRTVETLAFVSEALCMWEPQDFTFLRRMGGLSCVGLQVAAQFFHRVKYVVCKEPELSQRRKTAITCKGAQAEKGIRSKGMKSGIQHYRDCKTRHTNSGNEEIWAVQSQLSLVYFFYFLEPCSSIWEAAFPIL